MEKSENGKQKMSFWWIITLIGMIECGRSEGSLSENLERRDKTGLWRSKKMHTFKPIIIIISIIIVEHGYFLIKNYFLII